MRNSLTNVSLTGFTFAIIRIAIELLYFRSLRAISLLGSRRFSWYAFVVTIILYILLFIIRFRGIALFSSLYLLAVACKVLKKSAHPRIYDLKLFQTKYY